MLATIRFLRVLVGLIAVWQVIGLLPVLTNWLPNLRDVTGGMWAIAFIKFLVLLICGGMYFWLGRIKRRINSSDQGTPEGRIIFFAILGLSAIGIALAIVVPLLAQRDGGTEEQSVEAGDASGPAPELAQLAQSGQAAKRTPLPEEGIWECPSGDYAVFLFPDGKVFLKSPLSETNWSDMSASEKPLIWVPEHRRADTSNVDALTVYLQGANAASLLWPAGELHVCKKKSLD